MHPHAPRRLSFRQICAGPPALVSCFVSKRDRGQNLGRRNPSRIRLIPKDLLFLTPARFQVIGIPSISIMSDAGEVSKKGTSTASNSMCSPNIRKVMFDPIEGSLSMPAAIAIAATNATAVAVAVAVTASPAILPPHYLTLTHPTMHFIHART